MEDEPPMSLVEDHFDDMSIDDRPLDGEGSFYNEEELEEEEAQPTSENFSTGGRYRPSHHTPGQLPTIREEKHDDSRSNNGSRATSRPSSSNLKVNMSDNSHDFSGQFQNGINAIEQYTENFYSKKNDAERLFPEHQLLQPNFASPPFDKQNSWEPSVCHYEKQPTPEVNTDSPKMVFANLNKNNGVVLDKGNDEKENAPVSSRFSPERSVYTTSPLSSSRFMETKTSTPKRPGASNRLGQRHPPALELSTIYDMSPQRAKAERPSTTSRLFPPPAARITPASSSTSNYQSPMTSSSDTMMSNRTISESMVRNVLNNADRDTDLIAALDMARKRRERAPVKPDFRVKPVPVPAPAPVPALAPAPAPNRSQFQFQRSYEPSLPLPPPPATSSNTTSLSTSRQKPSEVFSRSGMDVSNSNTTNITNNMTRMSTAMKTASREDLSRLSSRSRHHSAYSSTSSVNTVISNPNSNHHVRDGRDSRASSVVSNSTVTHRPSTAASSATQPPPLRPLKIAARRMAFGVAQLSETLTMELEVENVSDRRCQVQASIDSKTSAYKILDNKMVIEPGKSTKLRVSFTPMSIGRYQVLLVVEVPAQNYQHKIAIWGIGGVAAISPVTSAQDLLATANPSEFAMYVTDLSRISFKIGNSGAREGFALITTFDSSMRPLPAYSVTCFPARGIILRRNHEKRIDIRVDKNALLEDPEDIRTSSAMSSISTATARRRAASGADLVIQIAWGDEVLRQRLKMLAEQTGQRQDVDGLDFTSSRFIDEDLARAVTKGFPCIVAEDFDLFASSYRSVYIFVYSSHSAFRRAASVRTSSSDSTESTLLETTAFRNQTFVNDATMVPRTAAAAMRK